jgi:hypothetical protein
MANEYDQYVYEDEGPRPWRWSIIWPALVVLGWLVYEITAQPALGVVVACTRVGWNDLITARWLLRIDANRGRGWTCFWLYVASAFWRIGLAGIVFMVAVACLADVKRGQLDLSTEIDSILATALGSIALTTLTVCLVIGFASRNRVKLWLNSRSMRQARKSNMWPSFAQVKGRNHAEYVVFVGLALLVYLVGPAAIVALIVFIVWLITPFLGVPPDVYLYTACFILLLEFVGSGMLIGFRKVFTERVVARTPAECWGPPAWKGTNLPDQEPAVTTGSGLAS